MAQLEKGVSLSPVEHLLVVDYYLSLLPKILVFSDGVVAVVTKVWLQSGRFKTSFWGSHTRSMLCSIVDLLRSSWDGSFPPPLTGATSNGDDCLNAVNSSLRLDGSLEDTVKGYAQCGYVLTDLQTSKDSEPWDFCSHIITRDTHFPASCTKTLLQLCRNKEITPELFDAFMYVNKDREDIIEIRDFVLSLGFEPIERFPDPT